MSVEQQLESTSPIEGEKVVTSTLPEQDGDSTEAQTDLEGVEEVQQPQIEVLEIEVLLPHESNKIKIPVAVTETVMEIRNSIIENPFTYFYSCFYLEHNDVRLNDYEELAKISGLKENPQIKLKEDKYTERETRIHILRLRELMRGYQHPCGKYGYDEGLSVFHAIVPNSAGSKKKRSKSEKSSEASGSTAFDDYNFDETSTLSLGSYTPSDYITPAPKCLRQLSLSGWNPIPPTRRLAGDLIYLSIVTNENKSFEITSSTSGFYVNNSTSETFDPSRKAPIASMQAHSLVHLLQSLSSGFRSNIAKIQQLLLASEPMQVFGATFPQVSYPWLATPRTSAYDPCRPCEAFLTSGPESGDSLRDWNEELQSQRELPQITIEEKLNRDRGLAKIYSEFFEACVQAAVSVAEGNIPPLNPNEPADCFMYLQNNLFISKTFDGQAQFESFGGQDAAYVATSKDIQGVKLLNRLDMEGVFTMGSALVDYRGERYVVQCVIPGLFRMQELIKYGTGDMRATIVTEESFHKLTAKVAEALHLAPHEVADLEGKTYSINLSLDAKGIHGAEGRRYLVDLHRLCPVDITFQESECVDKEGGFKAYPHKMTLLRHELVSLFWAHKYKTWYDENAKSGNKEDEKEEKKEEENKPEFDLRFNPDVFTDLCSNATEEEEANVRECSSYLQTFVLPTLANELSLMSSSADSSTLTKTLHERGVNMRYLGKLYTLLVEGNRPQPLKALVLKEMVLRAAKYQLRRLLRPLPTSLVGHCVSHFFNCLFADSEEANPIPAPIKEHKKNYEFVKLTPALLREILLETIATRFRYAADLESLASVSRLSLLRELCLVIGIQLLARNYQLNRLADDQNALSSKVNGHSYSRITRFQPSDIIALLPLVKTTFPTLSYPEEFLEKARQTIGAGQRQAGLEILNQALIIYEQLYSPISSETAHCYNNIAAIHYHLNDPKAAEEWQKKSVIVYERTLGLDHPDTLQALIQYGYHLNTLGKMNDALKYIRFAIDKWHALYGYCTLDIAYADQNLGITLQKMKRYDLSLKFMLRAVDFYEKTLGTENITTASAYTMIARVHNSLGDYKAAIAIEKKANAFYTKMLGPDHSTTARSTQALKDFTANAVYVAREQAYEKSPDFQELKLRVQQSLKKEAENLATPLGSPVGNRGHLPVDDLVRFIDGNVDSDKKKPPKSPSSPKFRKSKKKTPVPTTTNKN